MKRLVAFVLAAVIANPAHAFLGIGDITFDPTSYGVSIDQFNKMVEMYENAKKQLDTMVKMEQTMKEAQTAYETLGSFSMKNAMSGLRGSDSNPKTAAQLRAQVANVEGGAAQNAGYIKYQLDQIDQLDRLAMLQKASAQNAEQAANKSNSIGTNGAIAAQSAAATAALAAATEQRRIQDETAAGIDAKAAAANMKNSKKVYEAMGK